MPDHGVRMLAMLVLMSPALMTGAAAQNNRGHGGGGGGPAPRAAPAAPHISAPHISAPAPHFSAPAPHIAAPAPRVSAPVPHVVAAPRVSPHIAAPHIAAPHVSAPARVATPRSSSPQFARQHGGSPHPTTFARQHGRPSTTPQLSGVPQTSGRNTRHAAAPANAPQPQQLRGRTPAAPSTVGQGPAGASRNANVAGRSQTQIQGGSRRPFLRNPTFADLSTRDPALRSLARATFRGRFAQSPFDRGFDRRRHPGFVIGWAGPVFWPYAYDDFVDYTFYPYAYDTFWPYAFDDVYDSIYGSYAPDVTGTVSVPRSSRRGRSAAIEPPAGAVAQICSGQATGLTDFPIERIAQQVQPNDAQRAALDQLKAATVKAVDMLQSACPTDLPSTPMGRLTDMRQRIEAMLQAVRTVRPALDRFYQSLSDEQKERFNALDAESASPVRAGRGQADLTQVCSGHATNPLPMSRVEQTLRLDAAQQAALKELDDASAKAADILAANCPADQTLTPTGRLAAMAQRLEGMQKAISTVQPALAKFYNSLSDEQRARFDRTARPT